jgi:3-isopropylmalate dehydrogenase
MIEKAVADVLAAGLRTADIKGDATSTVSTTQMGDAVIAELRKAVG